MRQIAFLDVKRHRHREDGVTMLDCDDAARREAAAVTDAVNLVDDRHFWVAADQKIGVQGMWWPRRDVIDSAARRHQRLTKHLAAKHALPAGLRGAAAKQIHFQRLEVEDTDQVLNGGSHGLSGS